MVIAFVPRLLLRPFIADRAAAWHANVVLSHLLLLLSIPFWSRLIHAVGSWPHECLVRSLLGVPCPGCGITTSLGELSSGRWAGAWTANPAGLVLVLGLVVQLLIHAYVLRHAEHGREGNRLSRYIGLGTLVALLAVWLCRFPFHRL